MRYRTFIAEVLVTKQFINEAAIDTNEYIKRELAIKAVKSLPLKDLEKLFEFDKVTGDDEIGPFDSSNKRFLIMEMRRTRCETHIAKIKIPD